MTRKSTAAPAGDAPAALVKGDLKRRFFIAVMPPPGVTASLDGLRHAGPAAWDWKRHGDYHISLAFPGSLDDVQLARLVTTLRRVEHPVFDVRFEGLSYFLKDPATRKRNAQNVLWARADSAGDAALRSLHATIRDHLKAHKFPTGGDSITPHLTLAKTPANDNSLVRSFARAHDNTQSVPWRCDRFGLYETLPSIDPRHPDHNGGRGTRYVKIAEFALR